VDDKGDEGVQHVTALIPQRSGSHSQLCQLDSFTPYDYRLYLAIDFPLLWAFNLRRWMRKEGGK